MRCLVTSKSPGVKISVQAIITPENGALEKTPKKQLSDTILKLGSQNPGEEFPEIKSKNIHIDEDRKVSKTNRNGYATFNLKYISG